MPPNLANPFQVQKAPRLGKSSDVPLVLIHDGGGTIVSYTMLGNLYRTAYGIHNPQFYNGGFFAGGIDEMAALYTDMIKELVPEGPFLLGGWSLGGLLSLKIANNLAHETPSLTNLTSPRKLLGLILIDSPCPQTWARPRPTIAGSPSFAAHTNEEMRNRIRECMRNSGEMIKGYTLPQWRNDDSIASLPPPTVLIRCREFVPVNVEGNLEEQPVSRVDVAREESDLGWGEYWREEGFGGRTRLMETEGHHYNVFWAGKNLDCATEQIVKACELLEAGKLGGV